MELDEKPRLDMHESQVDVQAMVDETVRRVREQSDKLQAVAQPYANKTRDFAETRPVLFTFLAIFTAMSIIPVGLFVGFLLSSLVFILGIAATGICISCLGVIVFGATILIPVLFFTAFLSTLAVTSLLSIFLAHRLYLHLRASTTTAAGEPIFTYDAVTAGVMAWCNETQSRAGFEILPTPKSPDQGFKPMPKENGSKVQWANGEWASK